MPRNAVRRGSTQAGHHAAVLIRLWAHLHRPAEFATNSMLSVVASLTPYSDFNQSPRNMYQCQMAKQTMGTPAQVGGEGGGGGAGRKGVLHGCSTCCTACPAQGICAAAVTCGPHLSSSPPGPDPPHRQQNVPHPDTADAYRTHAAVSFRALSKLRLGSSVLLRRCAVPCVPAWQRVQARVTSRNARCLPHQHAIPAFQLCVLSNAPPAPCQVRALLHGRVPQRHQCHCGGAGIHGCVARLPGGPDAMPQSGWPSAALWWARTAWPRTMRGSASWVRSTMRHASEP